MKTVYRSNRLLRGVWGYLRGTICCLVRKSDRPLGLVPTNTLSGCTSKTAIVLNLRHYPHHHDEQHEGQAPQDVVLVASPERVKNAVHRNDTGQC